MPLTLFSFKNCTKQRRLLHSFRQVFPRIHYKTAPPASLLDYSISYCFLYLSSGMRDYVLQGVGWPQGRVRWMRRSMSSTHSLTVTCFRIIFSHCTFSTTNTSLSIFWICAGTKSWQRIILRWTNWHCFSIVKITMPIIGGDQYAFIALSAKFSLWSYRCRMKIYFGRPTYSVFPPLNNTASRQLWTCTYTVCTDTFWLCVCWVYITRNNGQYCFFL